MSIEGLKLFAPPYPLFEAAPLEAPTAYLNCMLYSFHFGMLPATAGFYGFYYDRVDCFGFLIAGGLPKPSVSSALPLASVAARAALMSNSFLF